MAAITASRAEPLPIGALSKRSGVNIETIRYYERIKMLAPPPRTASGRRVYGPSYPHLHKAFARTWVFAR
ncbi:MAG: MerR family DNA-binding transcriptional regulator [Xanthobacteraceae bacterium]